MVGMQHQRDVERLGGRLGWLFAVEHPEEVRRVRERGVRLHDLLALANAVEERDDHGDLRGEAEALADVGGVQHGLLVGIVDGEQRDCRAEDLHRARGLGQAGEEFNHIVGELPRGRQLVREIIELRSRGQASIPKQKSRLFEGRLLRELVDVDATIGQNPFASVDETDRGIIGNDVLQTLGCGGGHRCSSPENLIRTQYPAIIGQRGRGCHERLAEYRFA